MKREPSVSFVFRVVVIAFLLVGCGGPGRVQYDGGRCLKDGRPLSAQEVEDDQAEVSRRITSRQPWFAVITIGVGLVAAAGNVDKLLLFLRARHVEGHRSLAERMQSVLDRQRETPAVFAAIVGGSLTLIAIGGAAYVYLDIDKRASERALGTLQFCHLAIRTQEEEGVLDEQRHNLEAIQSTAGDIRNLVGQLPPDEQQKAHLIVDQMNAALTKQGKIVGAYAARTDEQEKSLTEHTNAMEKGLASVEGDLAGLRSLPASLKDLETTAHRIDGTTGAFEGRFDELRGKIAAVEAKVDALAAKPACVTAAPVTAKEGAGASAVVSGGDGVKSKADARPSESGTGDGGKGAP